MKIHIICGVDVFVVIIGICRVGFKLKRVIIRVFALAENFIKIFLPTTANNRTMGNYNNSSETRPANNFKRSECFTKTHFCIPKHFIMFLKTLYGFSNSLVLLVSQNDSRSIICDFVGGQTLSTFFNCFNSILCGFKVYFKPITTIGYAGLNFPFTRI